ncbi:MAG: hypothetical protein KC422_10050 [Trueperaceae bacterium]|nr:hypothetical protein [Trueperaceae bacterium]
MRKSFELEDSKTERLVKNLLWLAFSLFGLAGMLLGLLGISNLYAYFQRAQTVDTAINVVSPRKSETGRLIWLEDKPTPRVLEPFMRDQITNDYRRAYEELTYSFLTGDQSGLKTYFSDAALTDVLLASSSLERQKFIDWDHQLSVDFYSPDGSVLAFRDSYQYAQTSLDRSQGDLRIARRTQDVVLKQDEGLWKISQWRVHSDYAISQPEMLFPGLAETVRQMRGINYIARSSPFNELWPKLSLVEINADFATLSRLGFTSVRLFIPYPSPEGLEQFADVLDIAQIYDLQVIPTLLDTYTCYCVEDLPNIVAQFSQLYDLLEHPSVVLIDLKNEADRDFENAGIQQVRGFLSYLISVLQRETGKPVTVGLIEPDPVLSKRLDVISLHHYLSPEALKERLESASTYNKPVLLEEFGFHSWELKLPDPHTEREQALYYQEVLELARQAKAGWLAWTLYDLAEGDMPGGRRVERHLGLLKSDGQSKEVIRVLQGEQVNAPGLKDKLWKFRYFAAAALAVLLSLLLFIWIFKPLKKLKNLLSRKTGKETEH